MNGRRLSTSVAALALLPLGCGTRGEPTPLAPTAAAATEQRPSLPATPPLNPGDTLPPLPVNGWVNGPPPDFKNSGARLLVLDVSAAWCQYCRLAVPGWTRIHQKYSEQGVAFVSLTGMGRESAEAYSKQFNAALPTGYGLSHAGIQSLGASSGMAMPGYEVAPVVYLVGVDGRIRWTDKQGRFRHQDPEAWERDVDAAIAAALARP